MATTMNANAVPCPATTRSTMPTVTVMSATVIPEASEDPGLPRVVTLTTAPSRPTAKGQSVDVIAAGESPW